MKYFSILLMMTLHIAVFCQSDTTNAIQLNQVDVIKSFNVELERADRILVPPTLPKASTDNPRYNYTITIVPLELKYPEPQIKPLAMEQDAPIVIKKGYVDLGYGLLKNPSFSGGFHTSKKDTYDHGMNLEYVALDNTKKNAYQKYSDFGIAGYESRIINEDINIYGDLSYSSERRFFSHNDIDVAQLYSEEESKRNISLFNLGLGLKNVEQTRFKINYDVKLNLSNLQFSDTKARENSIGIKPHVEKQFNKGNSLVLDGDFNYTGVNTDTSFSLNNTKMQAYFKTQFAGAILTLGASYIKGTSNDASLFPNIHLSYGIIGQKLQAYIGIDQDYYKNTFANTYVINPYLNTNVSNLKIATFKDYFGGIKGKFLFMEYYVKTGFKQVNNQMFLLNNTADIRLFDMIFDDLNLLYISANLDAEVNEMISIGGSIVQNEYDLKTLAHPWHTPKYQANVYTNLTFLEDKFHVKGELFFNSSVPYLDKDNLLQDSNILFDLNTTATYDINHIFSVYISGQNILNNQFQRYYGYPSVGINGRLGIRAIF